MKATVSPVNRCRRFDPMEADVRCTFVSGHAGGCTWTSTALQERDRIVAFLRELHVEALKYDVHLVERIADAIEQQDINNPARIVKG